MLFLAARVLVGLLSVGFPALLSQIGLKGLGVLILALLVASLLIGTIWTPRTRGKSLEEIERERYGSAESAEAAVA